MPSPDSERPAARALLAINVVFGLAILASYAWGAVTPGVGRSLWGGVPEGLRPVYVVSMLSATLGYFPFTALLLRVSADGFQRETGWPYRVLFGLYTAILVPSALWLPLTAQMLATPSALLWVVIRFDLAAVGLGALGIVWVVAKIARTRGGLAPIVALVGAVCFAIQTALLDAVVWPAFWSG